MSTLGSIHVQDIFAFHSRHFSIIVYKLLQHLTNMNRVLFLQSTFKYSHLHANHYLNFKYQIICLN